MKPVRACLLILMGCLRVVNAQSAEQPYAGQTVSILLVQQQSTEEWRDLFIPQFEEQTGIDVIVDILPEAGADTKMVLALSGNTGEYDVLMTGAKNWSQLVSSGWIEPLDPFLEGADASFRDGFSESLLNTLRLDGNLYAIPFQVGANMLFYNKEMFAQAGLDPDRGPESLDKLLSYAQQLNKPEANQYGIVMRGTREGNANSFSWIMLWFLNGGRWINVEDAPADYVVLDLPPAIQTTEYYQELAQYAPPGISSYGFPEALLAMQQGRAAMWLDAAQLGPQLEDPEASTIAGNVGYQVIEGEGDDYIVGPVWALSMASSTENEGAAWELIQYLTSKDVNMQQVLSGSNGSPARADILADEQVREALNPGFADALLKAVGYANPHYTPLIPEGNEIRSALAVALSKVLSGQQEPEAAMREANEEVIAILRRAGRF